jgi:hypothetical protein
MRTKIYRKGISELSRADMKGTKTRNALTEIRNHLFDIFLILALFCSIPTLGRAALVETDLYSPGDQLLTVDTVTGRSWLDLPYTNGWSVDYARTQLPTFTVASTEDVLNLYRNVGLPVSGYCIPFCDVLAYGSIILELVEKIGGVYGNPPSLSVGFTTDIEAEYGISMATYAYIGPANAMVEAQITSRNSMSILPSFSNRDLAVWLYQEGPMQIDEPQSWFLVLLGMTLLWATRRRRFS